MNRILTIHFTPELDILKDPLTFRVWPLATALCVPQGCPHCISPQSHRVRQDGGTAVRPQQAVQHLAALSTRQYSTELSAEA